MRDEESVCLLIENVAYLIKQKLISAQTIEAVEWGIHMVLDERLPKHSRLVYDFLKAVVEFWNGINHAETKRTARCALTKRTCLTSRSRQATARINTKEHPGVCLDPNYSPPSLNRVKKNRHSSLTEIRNAQLAEQLEKRRTSSVDRRNAWNIERSLKRSASETEKRQQKQELEARKLDREKDRKIKEAARKEERKRQEEKRKEAMREYALRKKRLQKEARSINAYKGPKARQIIAIPSSVNSSTDVSSSVLALEEKKDTRKWKTVNTNVEKFKEEVIELKKKLQQETGAKSASKENAVTKSASKENAGSKSAIKGHARAMSASKENVSSNLRTE